MKIHKFSRIVSLPFAIATIVFIYLGFLNPKAIFLIWILIPVTALILIYLFEPQIDYWWLEKNPIDLDEKIENLITKLNPDYIGLSEEQKRRFNNRLTLYVKAIDISSKGMEREFPVPEDVKYMIAQVPVKMSMNSDAFLMPPFERVILYKHAFGSPRYKFLHTLETFLEDGVIILSMQHAEASFFHPTEFYNIVYHAYAEAFVKSNPALSYPLFQESDWEKFYKVSGFDKTKILNTVGAEFEVIDPLYVAMTLYFTNRQKLIQHLPNQTAQFDRIFKM